MARADWTYELPPATGDSVWLEEYLVYDADGSSVGRVFAVLEHEGRRWLGVEREPLPTRHDRRAVPFGAIAELDHENTAVHLTLGPDEIEETLELDPESTALPLLAVPGLLFGAAAFLAWRARSQPWLARR
jgi:hypothetical protein